MHGNDETMRRRYHLLFSSFSLVFIFFALLLYRAPISAHSKVLLGTPWQFSDARR